MQFKGTTYVGCLKFRRFCEVDLEFVKDIPLEFDILQHNQKFVREEMILINDGNKL